MIPAEAVAPASLVSKFSLSLVLAVASFSEPFFFALFVLAGAEFLLSEMVLLAGARQMELSQAW